MAVFVTHRPALLEIQRTSVDGTPNVTSGGSSPQIVTFAAIRRQYGSDFIWPTGIDSSRLVYIGARPLIAWVRAVFNPARAAGPVAGSWELSILKNGAQDGQGVDYSAPAVSGSGVGLISLPYPSRPIYLEPNDYLQLGVRQFTGVTYTTTSAFLVAWTTGYGPAGDEEVLT